MMAMRYGGAGILRRRVSVASVLVTALALGLSACGGSSGGGGGTASGPYTLGCLAGFSGPLGFSGLPERNGFETYVQYVNHHGGVHGRQINVTALDDANDTTKGKTNLQQAVADHSLGIFCGNDNPWATLPAFAAQNKTLQMNLAIPVNYIFPAQKYLYLAQFGAVGLAQEQIGFVKYLISQGKLPAKPKVGLIYFSGVICTQMDNYFKKEFKALGWPIVSDQQFPLTATSANTEATAVAKSKPDVVVTMLTDPSALFAVRELQQQGFHGPVVEFTGANQASTFQALNDPNYYSESTFAYPGDTAVPAAVSEVQQSKTYHLTQGNTSPFFTAGYVAAMVAVAALKKCSADCNSVDYNQAMNSLGTVNVNKLAATISVSSSQHQIVHQGQFYAWDPAKSAVTAAGPPVTASGQ
jgi:ABC-type branched-subunit amino acid transport system substrate-binding protein